MECYVPQYFTFKNRFSYQIFDINHQGCLILHITFVRHSLKTINLNISSPWVNNMHDYFDVYTHELLTAWLSYLLAASSKKNNYSQKIERVVVDQNQTDNIEKILIVNHYMRGCFLCFIKSGLNFWKWISFSIFISLREH